MPVRERVLLVARIAVVAAVYVAVYYGAAKLGLLQQLVRGQVTPLWPPTGVAVTALVLIGPQVWPGIALGAFAVNAGLGPSYWVVLAIAAGNTAAPVAAYVLLRRAGFRSEMDRLGDVLALIFLGALTAMLISATVGTSVLVASGALHGPDFWPTWSVWWTGDAMDVLVVTPVLLLLLRTFRAPRELRGIRPARRVEAAALAAAAAAAGYLATGTSNASLLFLAFPVLLWAAFRYQFAGAVPCMLIVSTLAILAAARSVGPFAQHGLLGDMVTLQAFNGTTALTALLLSAVILERNRTHEEIQRLCAHLADLVEATEHGTSARPGTGQGRDAA
jgi:integral membrane sensor domain MASE1